MGLAADPDLKNVGLMARVQIGQFWCWAARLWLCLRVAWDCTVRQRNDEEDDKRHDDDDDKN